MRGNRGSARCPELQRGGNRYAALIGQAFLNRPGDDRRHVHSVAVGFTQQLSGIVRVVNFAHGEFYMLGAFTAFFTYVYWEIPFVVCPSDCGADDRHPRCPGGACADPAVPRRRDVGHDRHARDLGGDSKRRDPDLGTSAAADAGHRCRSTLVLGPFSFPVVTDAGHSRRRAGALSPSWLFMRGHPDRSCDACGLPRTRRSRCSKASGSEAAS